MARYSVRLGLLCTLALTGCATSISTWDLAQRAVSAMGGARQLETIRILSLSDGEGTRGRLGQRFNATSPDSEATLSGVTSVLDFSGRRAAFEYDVALESGFMQHRIEVLTEHNGAPVGYSINNNGRMASSPGGLFSWGPQNSPGMELSRNPIVLLLDAASVSTGSDVVEEVEFNGNTRLLGRFVTSWGEEVALYFDPESDLLVGFETLDTEPMLGDVDARYILGNYQAAGDGLLLPHRLTILKDGTAFSDVRYGSITVNSPDAESIFGIPEDLVAEADRAAGGGNFVPLEWNEVSNGVYHVVAYSHHSMVVEFPSFVTVVEAPYTETQSLALAALIGERIPDKPIRYAAITHPHWDHTGGVRGIASVGATIVTASAHESQIRPLIDRPHTNPPDALEQRRASGAGTSIETFSGTWEVTGGPQTLRLYEVTGSPHTDPYVLAYLPASRILFQSDLFNPGGSGAGTAASQQLQQAIQNLRIDVTTLVGGHGGTGPFSELTAANR